MKSLAEMKRAINNGTRFKIITHYVKEECNGQIRKPNVIQTNGFYSIVENEPNNKVSMGNGGKGYWFQYEKANCYEFDGNKVLCKFRNGDKMMLIEFL